MTNARLSHPQHAWLALFFGALVACSGAAPESEQTEAPAERGSPSEGTWARGSVAASEGTNEQPTLPSAEDPAPGSEEGVEPASEEGVEPASEEGVELPAGEVVTEGDVIETVEPAIGDVPLGAVEPVAPALPDDPGLVSEPGTDVIDAYGGGGDKHINTSLSPETIGLTEPCAGAADGYYCAANLGVTTDKSLLYHCRAGVSVSVGECPGQCDSKINDCQTGAGTGGGSVHKASTAGPCIQCLQSACNGEMNACGSDSVCSAQWPCLTSCTTESCEDTCTYHFSTTGDDGQWRSCADHCASKCD